ncbi:hypothetical protein [Nocardia sp. CA-135398]|uniref:hypothetical protein n=1 Tax=Nocardia sp. CA-135398 TaxID=3239977 RepID=UPI003D981915
MAGFAADLGGVDLQLHPAILVPAWFFIGHEVGTRIRLDPIFDRQSPTKPVYAGTSIVVVLWRLAVSHHFPA